MDVLRGIFLGIVQGLTEFLPVSSSGHLHIIQKIFGQSQFGLAFDTMLHVATLLAVLIYFREDFIHMARAAFSHSAEHAADRRLAWLIAVATIPTGIIGLIGNDWFEHADTLFVGIAFLVTSALLTATELLSAKTLHSADQLGWKKAVVVGIAQGIAIMPGISRSGATMTSGLSLGLDREQAARFSFLLSAPIILLAGGKQALDVISGTDPMPGLVVSLAGFIAAAVTGYIAVAGLMAYIRKHSFYPFAIYTAGVGLAVIVWHLTS